MLLLLLLQIDPIPMEQDRNQDQEVKVKFQFKDAPIEEVLDYVGKVTGLQIENEAKATGKVTAWSDAEIPVSHVLAFLDSALDKKYGLVKMGNIVKVLKYEDAKKRTLDIRVTRLPEEVPPTEQVLTVIYPLKNLNVVEVNKELDDLYPRNATVLMNTYSNTLIITGRGDEIHKMMVVFSKLDVEAKEQLVLRVIMLKNADATETAKMINDLFVEENAEQSNPLRGFMSMMMRGGRGEGPGGVEAKEVASQIIRVVADIRTNSVLIASTEAQVEKIAEVVRELDEVGSNTKVGVYGLKHADANSVADTLNDLFTPKRTNASTQAQGGRGGGGGRNNMFWMGGRGMQGGQQPQAAAETDFNAVADLRTNTVIVTASEAQLAAVDQLMDELDKPMTEYVTVRVFRLRNADATETASQISTMFNLTPTTTTQQTGGGRRNQQQMQGAQQTTGGMMPSQQVDVVADARTNSVIVKASVEYMGVVEQMVRELDKQPSEDAQLIVYRARNVDPAVLVEMLRSVTGGQKVQQQRWSNPFSQYRNTQGGGNNQNQNPFGNVNTRGGNSGGGNNSTRTFRQLSPFEEQDAEEPPPAVQDQEEGGLRGTLEVESDGAGNLIIRTAERNRAALMALLADLDRIRPQVMIKCRVVDVAVDDALAFGVEGNLGKSEFNFVSDFAEFNPTRIGQGVATLTGGVNDNDYDIRLQALARDGRVKILATPSILVIDNEIADITIGREVPFIDSTQQTPQGGTLNTIRYEDIGVILQVQPHINPDGKVTMAVHPEVSDIDETRSVPISEGVTSPTFTKNAVTTMVTIRNGQTVVIGGLIRESDEDVKQKVPILGDIPGLGLLFSRIDKTKQKRELMIFLTPYVVYSEPQLDELHQLEKASLRLIDERDLMPEGRRWRTYMWR